MLKILLRGFVFLFLFLSFGLSQKLAVFDIDLKSPNYKLYIPVHINLDDITFLNEDQLELLQVVGDKKTPISLQVKKAENRYLYWFISPGTSGKYHFELMKTAARQKRAVVKFKKNNGLLTIFSENRNLLGYHYETVYPPQGVDSAYQRSAFIHPLWSPRGQVLTRIQPPDHYHHYGIWNPWTHVLFEGDTLDFWNLVKKQGTVRFNKFISLTEGSVFAEFRAIHEHVAFKKDGTQKVALNELQTVRVYRPQETYYIVDLNIDLNCASDSLVKLLKYRYGGFGWRATEQWGKNNSEMLSSEGKTRIDIDNTTGRWFYVQGEVDSDYAGVLMMSYPSNFNHPQPLRMWGISEKELGDVFACFSPTRNTDWLLEPGRNYILKYRFVVYNGHFNADISENSWKYYANPPEISIKKTTL